MTGLLHRPLAKTHTNGLQIAWDDSSLFAATTAQQLAECQHAGQ